MEFSIKQGSPEKLKGGCVVVGVFEGGKLSTAAQIIDKATKHALSDLIARGDMSGKSSSTLCCTGSPVSPPSVCCWSAWARPAN